MTNLLFLLLFPAMIVFGHPDPVAIDPAVSKPVQGATVHLAKSVKVPFKAAAAPKPPVARSKPARTPPAARKSTARPAPAPKGFGTRMSPGGKKIAPAAARASTRARPATHAAVRNGTKGTLSRNYFNRVAPRGALRPKFNNAARPQKNLAGTGGGRGGGTKFPRAARIGPNDPFSLTRTFNRASGAVSARSSFNKVAASRPTLRPGFGRAVQRGRASRDFRKSAAKSKAFPGSVRTGRPKIKGFTKHGINQVINRGVSPRSLLDTVRNPGTKSRSFIAGPNAGTTQFRGKTSTVALNRQGKVVSAWKQTPRNWLPY